MTEFALILPFLALLVLVFVLLGKALWAYIELTHAANEGARLATVNQPTTGSLESYLQSEYALPSGAHVAICYPAGTQNIGDPVEVEVYTSASWVPVLNIGSLNAVATMRLEQSTAGNPVLNATAAGCNQ